MSDVIVIGGGLAGLAASVALANAGVPVTLLESRPRLGGRASSFEDATTGELIDNCQHVAMGCCTNFRRFCQLTGLERSFQKQELLTFVGPPHHDEERTPDFCQFTAAAWLPAPLHLAGALARVRYLSWLDKLRIAMALRSLVAFRPDPQGPTDFAAWLNQQRQSPNAVEFFWNVVLVSALSESLDRISVTAARKVFVDGFLAHREGWEVWLPTVPLDQLYSDTLMCWLAAHRTDVRLKSGVERLTIERNRVTSVTLRSGDELTAKHVVLAIPHHRVAALLPEELRRWPEFANLEHLPSVPIASVHLWFDRPLTELPHAVLVGRQSQWIFHRGVVERPLASRSDQSSSSISAPRERLWSYQVVISNAREISQRPQAAVVDDVVAELKAIWPWAQSAKLRHSRVVVEHTAVFSPSADAERLRPTQQSSVDNLQLAGDWTQTGWPATMEGAVRSGFLAAENILRQRGDTTRSLAPDLPPSWLSKQLFPGLERGVRG